jgi:MFS family permease
MGVNINMSAPPPKDQTVIDVADAPEFERVKWHKDPGLRKLYLVSIFGLMVASATTGYDGSLLNTVQSMSYWENYYDNIGTDKSKSNLLGLLTNMFTIGSIVSMFIVPPVTDRFGRKPPIIAGCVLMIIGGIVSALAKNYGTLCAGRFILGFGNSLAQLTSPMLLTEIIHPQHRAPVTAVYNCLWNLGSLSMLTLASRVLIHLISQY